MTDTKRRGRPPKARLEGAAFEPAKQADPVPGNNGEALSRIAAYFKAEHPAEWDELRLCPLQHGLDAMAERLK